MRLFISCQNLGSYSVELWERQTVNRKGYGTMRSWRNSRITWKVWETPRKNFIQKSMRYELRISQIRVTFGVYHNHKCDCTVIVGSLRHCFRLQQCAVGSLYIIGVERCGRKQPWHFWKATEKTHEKPQLKQPVPDKKCDSLAIPHPHKKR
jgi:hypothetical protein